MAETLLAARNLRRSFGGLCAVSDVSLELQRGVLHAVLGPNGAGKSTLINLLAGLLAPSSGTIHLRGADVTRLPPERRSHLGLGRSFQKTNIFPAFSVFENCRLAAQSRAPRAFRIFSDALADRPTVERAAHALERTGLAARAQSVAAELSHGEQRQLEIAMVLATAPEVLLLDEPLAGMGAEESRAVVALIRTLVPDHAVLLVEHDMDAVFAVADIITVMVDGRVLESGAPADIRRSPAVMEAYLGADPPPRG
jgi:branched-chain amino acid transport system ATP-binding protein